MTAAIAILAALAVRNPFWPIGFEGTREVISAAPVVEVKSANTQNDDDTATAVMAARTSTTITRRQWVDARKSLKIGGTAVVTSLDGTKSQCVMINGLVYANGDYVSANHNGRRFTWRVQGLTEGETLKLRRVRARFLEEDEIQKEEVK